MINTIKAWWPTTPNPGNFGDILTPYLLWNLFEYKCVLNRFPFKEPTLMGVGSIISRAEGYSIIWGSGLMRSDGPLKRDARYLSVRGPLTYEKLKEKGIPCPAIFGDPALLMPKIYSPQINSKFEYGILPHYVDYDVVKKWYQNDTNVHVINVLNSDPTKVIDQVLLCDKIISSSLHGVIIAHAYNIPAIWVKHSDKLSGDGVKFEDYFESVGMKSKCTDFQNRIDPSNFSSFDYQVGISIDINKIEKALGNYLKISI